MIELNELQAQLNNLKMQLQQVQSKIADCDTQIELLSRSRTDLVGNMHAYIGAIQTCEYFINSVKQRMSGQNDTQSSSD